MTRTEPDSLIRLIDETNALMDKNHIPKEERVAFFPRFIAERLESRGECEIKDTDDPKYKDEYQELIGYELSIRIFTTKEPSA